MALFSQRTRDEAQAGLEARSIWAGPKREGIRSLLEGLGAPAPDTADALGWLYAASPISDWINYDPDLFLACAAHGVYLRENALYEVPEDIFLNYVLHIRVNEEDLCNCRPLFYDLLSTRLRGLSPQEAVLEANCWCAEQVAYCSTDDRTRSALAVWRSGFGRCGEESVFAVNALRSVGIPARQVYTPRWSHCDDNHAWVEAWVDGGWHFMGACEPEAVLDRGWFTNAASRAMVIHSRRFGPSDGGEEAISQAGAVTYLNQLPRYADTTALAVRAVDPAGQPVEGAEVAFGILNMCEYYPAAVMETGPDGTVRLTCGLGSLCVRVRKGGVSCERLVFTPDADKVEIVLEQEAPALDTWEDFSFLAPRDRPSPAPQPTEAQKALGREKAAAAARKRAARVLPLPSYSPEEASVLDTLSPKDRLDAPPEVLREALETSRGYEGWGELFRPCVLCPRITDEPLRPSRRFFLDYFPQKQKNSFRKFPWEIWDFIRECVIFGSALEYDRLVTLPAGVLEAHNGSPLSQKILFVSICRALGVPARLNPVDGRAEYYWEGDGFRAVDAPKADCTVTLEYPDTWQYRADFAAAVLEDGTYRTLDLPGRTFSVRPGDYRIITGNRLPNGDLFASRYFFHLEPGEAKTIRLHKHQADLSQMLGSYALEEFTVYEADGTPVSGSSLTQSRAVLLWLEEGAEPTEHILNELLERRDDVSRLPADIVFLVRDRAALENAKLRQVLDAFPAVRVLYDSFVPNVETIARRTYVDHEKLPLIVVTTKPLNAVYASSGYNVGSGDMILRVCGIS